MRAFSDNAHFSRTEFREFKQIWEVLPFSTRSILIQCLRARGRLNDPAPQRINRRMFSLAEDPSTDPIDAVILQALEFGRSLLKLSPKQRAEVLER